MIHICGVRNMYLISYDMSTDKLRNKVAKELENYGKRVQYSVFECDISPKQLKILYGKLTKIMSLEKEGNIRIYTLCARCQEKLRIIGDQPEVQDFSDVDVIIV